QNAGPRFLGPCEIIEASGEGTFRPPPLPTVRHHYGRSTCRGAKITSPVHRCDRPSPPWPWSALPLAPRRGYIETFATWLITRLGRLARRKGAREPAQARAVEGVVGTPGIDPLVEDAELSATNPRQQIAQPEVVADV